MKKARLESRKNVDDSTRNAVLKSLSDIIENHRADILSANAKDLESMATEDPKYDRLRLDESRLTSIIQGLNTIASLPSPLDRVLYTHYISQGLSLKKISVPLGVICIIYESRPNVTIDAFALSFKAGNVCILKGGKEAYHTNQKFIELIHLALSQHLLSSNHAVLLSVDRAELKDVLSQRNYIDVVIPRGSHKLIEYVRENATIPVIETGAGVVHTYIDYDCDHVYAKKIIFNAKTRRVSVCNALDCLLVHKYQLANLLSFVMPLAKSNVTIYADKLCYQSLNEAEEGIDTYPFLKKATPSHDGYEFLDHKLLVKSVDSIDEAIEYINTHGSHHSEAIISNDSDNIKNFQTKVDASTIYVNASTAFTDGEQFGYGGEIGISTQKLHVRGPMGLEALTTSKFLIVGQGSVREP